MRTGCINVFGKGQVVSRDSIVVTTDYVFARCFRVGSVEETWIELEHLPEIFDRLFVIALFLSELGTRVKRHRVLVVRLDFDRDLSLHFLHLACCQQPVILGPTLSIRRNLAVGVVIWTDRVVVVAAGAAEGSVAGLGRGGNHVEHVDLRRHISPLVPIASSLG